MPNRTPLIAGIAVAATVLVAGGVYLGTKGADDPYGPCRATNVAGGLDDFGTDFTLTSETGARVTAAQVFTKPTLLYFGYTFCPDICPLDAARNAEAEAVLGEQGEDVQSVFVTIDPRRDTPGVLRDYTDLFSDDMLGLTGSDEEIAQVSGAWRNYFKLRDETDKEYYLVDHMTNTFLVMPGNKTVEIYNRDVAPDEMAESVGCFIHATT